MAILNISFVIAVSFSVPSVPLAKRVRENKKHVSHGATETTGFGGENDTLYPQQPTF